MEISGRFHVPVEQLDPTDVRAILNPYTRPPRHADVSVDAQDVLQQRDRIARTTLLECHAGLP